MTKKRSKKPDLDKLSPQQELFCQLYSRSGECFGNAALSYATAYEHDYGDNKRADPGGKLTEAQKANKVCGVRGAQLLAILRIRRRCEEILDAEIGEEVVDKELRRVILQNKEIRTKVAAISEYNKLHGRITEKHKHKFDGVSTEEIEKRAAELIAGIVGANK